MRKGKEVRNGNEHEKERENEKKALFLTGVPRAADEAGRLGAGLEQPRQSVPDLVHDGEEGGVHVAEERERCWWKKKRLVEVEEVEVEIALLMPPLQDRRVLSLPPPWSHHFSPSVLAPKPLSLSSTITLRREHPRVRVRRTGTHQDALGDGDGRRGQRSFLEAGRRGGGLAAARAEGRRSHDDECDMRRSVAELPR
jgi:hypothetical protein